MKKILLLFILSCQLITANSQVTIREIKGINPASKEKYVFPLVLVSGNTAASNRINDLLARDFLDIDRKKVKKSIFENVWQTKEGAIPVLSHISYKTLNNDKRIFSLAISAEGCGAYCEEFTSYYAFNTGTGKQIKFDSLFTKEGIQLVIDSLNKGKRSMIKTKLEEIADTLDNHSSKWERPEDKHYYEEMKDLYEDCMQHGYWIENTDYLRFYLTKNKLVVLLERCSAHVNRAIDELDQFIFEFKWTDWQKYLSPYARRLVN